MVCQVVNSQAQVQSRLPTLPQQLPKTQQDWNALLFTLNQWGSILQQASHAPNVIPSQFQTFTTSAASAVIAALSAVNCTPSVDNTQQYYGGASLKAVIGATGATLAFAGFPISIAGGTRWFCSFQILAPSGCTASLTVSTSAAHSVTESFTVAASASWQQVWGLFDLRQYVDTQATWKLTFTSTATVNIDGMQMNAVGDPIGVLPKFAGTQMVLGSVAYATNLDQVPDGSTYERMPGANMDVNRRGLIDFTQGGHVSKNIDNISDGSTFARFLASGLSSGIATTAGLVANAVSSIYTASLVANSSIPFQSTAHQVFSLSLPAGFLNYYLYVMLTGSWSLSNTGYSNQMDYGVTLDTTTIGQQILSTPNVTAGSASGSLSDQKFFQITTNAAQTIYVEANQIYSGGGFNYNMLAGATLTAIVFKR